MVFSKAARWRRASVLFSSLGRSLSCLWKSPSLCSAHFPAIQVPCNAELSVTHLSSSLFSCGSSVSGSCLASFILVKMKLCKDSRLSLILLKAPLPALGKSTGVVGESVTITLWAQTSAFSWGIITPTACTLLYSFVGSPMPLRLDVKSLLHLLYF